MRLMERMTQLTEGVPHAYHPYKETVTKAGITELCAGTSDDDGFKIGHSELNTNVHWCANCPDLALPNFIQFLVRKRNKPISRHRHRHH